MAQFYKDQRNSERDSWTMHSEPQDLLAHPLIRSIQHYCNVGEQHDYENVVVTHFEFASSVGAVYDRALSSQALQALGVTRNRARS
jgi:hypothetical protein